jgi:hypothetical protein
MSFATLLETLSERLGTPLEDAGGATAVDIDGNPVVLQDAGDLLLLRTEIGDLPDEGREALLTAVLEANHLYAGTGGGTLALEPGVPRLVLQKYTWFDRLDPDAVPDLIARFAATADSWRRLLADYSPSSSASPDSPPPPSTDILPV